MNGNNQEKIDLLVGRGLTRICKSFGGSPVSCTKLGAGCSCSMWHPSFEDLSRVSLARPHLIQIFQLCRRCWRFARLGSSPANFCGELVHQMLSAALNQRLGQFLLSLLQCSRLLIQLIAASQHQRRWPFRSQSLPCLSFANSMSFLLKSVCVSIFVS